MPYRLGDQKLNWKEYVKNRFVGFKDYLESCHPVRKSLCLPRPTIKHAKSPKYISLINMFDSDGGFGHLLLALENCKTFCDMK